MLGDHEHEAMCINCGVAMVCYDCMGRQVDQLCLTCEERIAEDEDA